MNPAVLAGVLFLALAALAVVLNHCHARLALVELALNEGLPPGHETMPAGASVPSATKIDLLQPGVHIFLSRSCHACQRLIEELQDRPLQVEADISLRYVDRPRPLAAVVADGLGAALHEHQSELAVGVGADPVPYTIAIGPHQLVSQLVSPTIEQVRTAATDAGIVVGNPVGLDPR